MDESQYGVKRLCDSLNDAAQIVGLQINEQKTEYMIIGRKNWMDHVLEVDHFKFKIVNPFKYLCSILTEKNDIPNQGSRSENPSGEQDLLWFGETIKFKIIIKEVKETFVY